MTCSHENIVESRRFEDGSIDGRCLKCGEDGFPIRDVPYEKFVASGEATACGLAIKNLAIKKDAGKVRMDLLSEVAIEGLARVLTFGAEKYAEDNWRKGLAWRRCIGAALRHITEFMKGNDLDDESGLPHIDHALCCLMFLSEYQKHGTGTDDRWKHLADRKTP